MTESAQPLPPARPRFKPYPAYKDSGVEWLGEIPVHWEVLAARRLISLIEQGWSPVAEDRLAGPDEWAVIKLSAVNKGRFVGDEHKALPADLAPDRRFEIREGDFLLTRANTPELVGDVCVAREVRRGLMLSDLVYRLRLGSDQIAPSYLAYWFLSRAGRYQIEVDARGSSQSMVKVSQGLIRAWSVVLPPAPEQRAVAAFLDRETARIDALVAKKERLIELLQEQRTALITRAVTKGLDPNVPMKDSGVEWLGEIPAHWEVKPLKYFLRVPLAYGVLKPDKHTGEDGVRLIRILDVESGQVREDALDLISPEQSEEFRRTIVRTGDLVVSVVGTIGRAFVVPTSLEGANLSRALARVQLKPTLSARFLEYGLDSTPFESFVELVPAGTAQRVLNLGDLAEYQLATPPPSEQNSIVAQLKRETVKTDALMAKVRDAIDRLKELRTALISAAATGKIDVREAVA